MRNLLRQKFFIFLLAIITLSSCSQERIKSRTIELKTSTWGNYKELKILNESLMEFEKRYPNIKVSIDHIPQNYIDKVLTEIAGGVGPDVMWIQSNGGFAPLVRKGLLLDLSPYFAKDKEIGLGDFFPEIIDYFTVRGETYCVPTGVGSIALVFYNKRLFDEAEVSYPDDDWDWNDLLDKAKKLTLMDKEGKTKQYGFITESNRSFPFSNGGRVVDDMENPTKCLEGEKEFKEGLQFLVDLIHKYKVSPSISVKERIGMDARQMFMSGRLAMYNSGLWNVSIFEEMKDFDWDVTIFPRSPHGGKGFLIDYGGMGVLKTTKYPAEAWELAKWLATDWQRRVTEIGGGQPANKKMHEQWIKSIFKPKNKDMLIETVKYGVSAPILPEWPEIEVTLINPSLYLLLEGKISVDEYADRVIPKVNEAFKELKNKYGLLQL